MARQVKTLSAGRPPPSQRPRAISRKRARRLINEYHQLQKQSEQAGQQGDDGDPGAISSRLAALGGIEGYQRASLQGQRKDRGGDTSKILVDWIGPRHSGPPKPGRHRLRLLEVGALSTHNACSISPLFEIERIDLNSQSPGILKQDFMQRPLPNDDSESFDIISLSLVLNFVPTPQARGDMLKRTVKHLRSSSPVPQAEPKHLLPGLFMVLPAPCVLNSRYLDEATLVAIMASLSYAMVRQKVTSKLHYTLWQWHPGPPAEGTPFKKQEILGGRARNNFAITLG